MRKLKKRGMGVEAAVLEMGTGAMLNGVCVTNKMLDHRALL